MSGSCLLGYLSTLCEAFTLPPARDLVQCMNTCPHTIRARNAKSHTYREEVDQKGEVIISLLVRVSVLSWKGMYDPHYYALLCSQKDSNKYRRRHVFFEQTLH
jgi:hypothetical protein